MVGQKESAVGVVVTVPIGAGIRIVVAFVEWYADPGAVGRGNISLGLCERDGDGLLD